MNFLPKFTVFLGIVFNFLSGPAFCQETYICVWRNPERTMTKIFPKSADYRTVTKNIFKEQRDRIELRLGAELLPGQREQYQYYEMLDSQGGILGYIIAASQKGEYGAIEFVFGLSVDRKIIGMYIQRAREKDKEFKQDSFLTQFMGKGFEDESNLGQLIKARMTVGVGAVIAGVRKELITFDEINR